MEWFTFVREVGFAVATASILLWFLINTVNTQITKIIQLLNEITNKLTHLDQIGKMDDKIDKLTFITENLHKVCIETNATVKAMAVK